VLAVCVVLGPRWIVGTGDGLSAAERLKAERMTSAPLCSRDSAACSPWAGSRSVR